jgi:hypothetical protein
MARKSDSIEEVGMCNLVQNAHDLVGQTEEQEQVLEYTAVLNGCVNDQEIIVTGAGKIIVRDGLTEGTYELVKLPTEFDPAVLEAVLITGYPNACAPLDGSPNVFQGKSYHYRRLLSFQENEQLLLNAVCQVDGNRLTSKFTLKGTAPKVKIEDVAPLVEAWEPTGSQEIAGQFRIVWQTVDGGYIRADAQSEYFPGNSTANMPVLHRYISISAKIEGRILTLTQKSLVFHHLPIQHG